MDRFGSASGLIINWMKSVAYWLSRLPKLAWMDNFCFTWVPLGSLSKLLGALFGITLVTQDIDNFLEQKIAKKLKYWTTKRLSLAKRITLVMPLSSLRAVLLHFHLEWVSLGH